MLRKCLIIVGMLVFIGSACVAEAAAPRRAKTAAKAKSKAKAKGKVAGKGKARPVAEEAPPPSGKVAVFAFDGDERDSVRKHVVQALADRGLTVDTSLRPSDTAEQYRDMGAALELVAYVHGRIKDTSPDHATATIVIRSGVTGKKITTVAISGFRRGLPYDVEEQLWDRVAPALKRASVEASKPGRRHNEPTRIEAGTPL